VTYKPITTAGNHKITATYDEGSSALHASSSGYANITARLRTTSTSVVCVPSVVVQIGISMTCTATVIDTDPAGVPLAPTGTVTFTRDGILPLTCELGAPGTDRSSCSVSFTSVAAQVWVLSASYGGSNKHMPSASEAFPIVFYDPTGGFVTGGGYVNHQVGTTNPAAPGVVGKDNFGFNAKYLKNYPNPTGETEFQCKVCNINFHSTGYEWLVISTVPTGLKAQYKGSGTINGAGNFGFIVTVIDGGQTDTARIKIWDKSIGPSAIIYDNEFNLPDNTNPTTVTAGGNIVVHSK
jgi:hypothetical protein